MFCLQLLILPYVILFLLVWKKIRKKVKDDITESTEPIKREFISVIIPVKNESTGIRDLLRDLTNMKYPDKDYEIIIVDDKSIDNTMQLAMSLCSTIPNLRVIQNEGSGKKRAICTALKIAKGGLIITSDGDCRAQHEWLSEVSDFHSSYQPDMIIGAVDIIAGKSFINKFAQLDFLSLQATTEAFIGWGQAALCNGANLAFRKTDPDKYLEIVKPDIPSGDDIFLLEYFRKDKKNIRWIDKENAIIKTWGPENLHELFSQRVRWSSKSINYKNPALILLSSLVLATNLIIISSLLLALFDFRFLILCLLLYFWKSIPDFLIISRMAVARRKTGLLWWFIPSAILYPFYTVIIAVAGLTKGLFSLLQDK